MNGNRRDRPKQFCTATISLLGLIIYRTGIHAIYVSILHFTNFVWICMFHTIPGNKHSSIIINRSSKLLNVWQKIIIIQKVKLN